MDREYLEDYEQREKAEAEELLKRIQEGRFNFGKDKYPSNDRFIKLQDPVAKASVRAKHTSNIWAQIPFCGSLIINIPAYSRDDFERVLFKVTEIPDIIDFIKETGKLQVMFNEPPTTYEGLQFLDPLFIELTPPIYSTVPIDIFGAENDRKRVQESFVALSKVKYADFVGNRSRGRDSRYFWPIMTASLKVYMNLKLGHYAVVEEIENSMIDDPELAYALLAICQEFIVDPLIDIRCDLWNFTLEEIKDSQELPPIHQPIKAQFPCEIGKFLMKKLTYAPQGIRACYDLIDHYNTCDLQKVAKSLNDGIVSNHPDAVAKNAEELSEILDNIWNDKTIPNRIKNIEIGVPVSIAAIGGIVAGLPGLFAGGFLSELGFKVVEKATEKYAEKLFSVKGEGLTERLAKLRTKSYQANIYDFKKKYNK